MERLDSGAVEVDPANVVPDGLARAGALDLLDLAGAGVTPNAVYIGKFECLRRLKSIVLEIESRDDRF